MANKKTKVSKPLNFVAKYAHQFNRSVTFKDKTKYNRKGRSKSLPFDFQAFRFYLLPPLILRSLFTFQRSYTFCC
jgi:hypothetical protein